VDKLGGNPKDILLGNKTQVFSKFRKELVDPDQQRKAYYYTDPPPTTFDEEGTVWLKKYWHRVAKDRQPRDRAQEKRMREMKKRATTAQGGSMTAADDMSD
jgi:protein involved in temperature-dependent protein secretion